MLATEVRELTVREVDTATAVGSGDVPVLATPRILALAEAAAAALAARDLEEGETTVGTWAEVDHLAASAVGATVVARAELTGRDGRALAFSIEVRDGDRVVAQLRHRRVVVERERFLARLEGQAP